MPDYDWLDSSSDIMDALDAAEARAYAAESALAETPAGGNPAEVALTGQPFSWSRLLKFGLFKLESMIAAGSWAYAAYTVFDKEDPNNPGKRVPHMPEAFGIGADVWSGVGLSALAFFGKIPFLGKLPVEALPHLDRLGTGSLDHWAVVAAQRAGAASVGIDVSGKVGGEDARTGGEAANTNQDAQVAGSKPETKREDPTAYMTPAQKRQYDRFRPRRAA